MRVWIAALLVASMPSEPAAWERVLDNEYYKVSLNVRARIELADVDGFRPAEAYTVRTLAGIGTKPWHGLSVFGELENSSAIEEDEYFDLVEPPDGNSPIADPPETELNQLYLRYENADLAALGFTGGRQRILLDDQRFVGNVGWRQNEQTFDAVWASSSLGLDGLRLGYGYVWDVRRPFGDGGPAALRDFESDSHLINLAHDAWDVAQVVLFAYLLDLENSPGSSSNSYGLRVTGSQTLGGGLWAVGYAGSYAYQTDAADNPVSYGASYVATDANVGHDGVGTLGVGYELLGSDDGTARFVTPLATAHKFNGFADAFVDNGGVNGLQDLSLYVAPTLPWRLGGQVVYHRFWSDEGARHLGDEVDVVLSRPLTRWVTLLTKWAYFEGGSRGPADRWRFWLQATFSY